MGVPIQEEQRLLKELLTQVPAHLPALDHVRGSLQVDVGSDCLGVIRVEDGQVTLLPGPGKAEAVVTTAEGGGLMRLLQGEMNAIVATIQGNIDLEGDLALASKILRALQADVSMRKRREAAKQRGAAT
ncbi:MAG: SCP2 sterol-binding domain-containing protein [Myxococcales bacterium]